jgi:hypothetical protein
MWTTGTDNGNMRFDGGPQQDIGGIPYIIVSNKAIGWEVLAYT